jgi:hypothetical protein
VRQKFNRSDINTSENPVKLETHPWLSISFSTTPSLQGMSMFVVLILADATMMISLNLGIPSVTFISPLPAKWKVFNECRALPHSTLGSYDPHRLSGTYSGLLGLDVHHVPDLVVVQHLAGHLTGADLLLKLPAG